MNEGDMTAHTHHLTTSGGTTSNEFPVKFYTTSVGVRGLIADQIIYSQFNSFFRGNTLVIASAHPLQVVP